MAPLGRTMKGIIVVDGPDAVGKTSLARAICSRTNGYYIHLTYRMKDQMFLYQSAALRFAAKKSQSQLVVIDRHWPSEATYGQVYRTGSSHPLMGRMMDRVLLKHSALYVLCIPTSRDPMEVARRHAEMKGQRVEMYDGGMEKIAQKYIDLYYGKEPPSEGWEHDDYNTWLMAQGGMRKRLDTLVYDMSHYMGCKQGEFIDELLGNLHVHQKAQFQPAHGLLPQPLGHARTAKFLFIGEKLKPKTKGLEWPFYEYRNSSLFLTQALHLANHDETKAMWVNACDPGGEDIAHLLSSRYQLKVVALGMQAQYLAEDLHRRWKVKYHCCRHPQYAKRFWGPNALSDYAQHLAEALHAS